MTVTSFDPPDGGARLYLVVVNDEEQHSIWRADKDLPNGWRAVGPPRAKKDCLEYIEAEWRDMRPRSLRSFSDRGSARTG